MNYTIHLSMSLHIILTIYHQLFGIHVIIELLETIENMVIDLGGEILSPFIFRKKQLFYGSFQEHFIEHVKMFNGQITSARITRKMN